MNRLAKNRMEIIELAKANPNFTVEDPQCVVENMTVSYGNNKDRTLGFLIIFGPARKDIYFEFYMGSSKFTYDSNNTSCFEVSGESYNGFGYSKPITNSEFYRQLSRFISFLNI